MGCTSSPYVNFSNLLADGCCDLIASGPLQFMSKEYYSYMAPFIMDQLTKIESSDAFGRFENENKALDVVMDIHMLYGFLLSVQYQRLWDAELDEVCHEDFGNKYYWDKYKFACIAKHFMCYNLNIVPALDLFNINQEPLFVNGIGHMHIFEAAEPDCADFTKTCTGSAVPSVQSVSLEDILIDSVSIAPSAHTETTMALMLGYVKTLLEGLYPFTFTIVDNGNDNFQITVCAPHGVVHPLIVEIVTEYHFLPALITGASFATTNGTGDPFIIQWDLSIGMPLPGIYSIFLRDTFWVSPVDNILVSTQVFYADICAIAADVLTYLDTNYPGVYSLISCSGHQIRLANATGVDIIVGIEASQWLQPAEITQECSFLSTDIEGGEVANPEDDECTTNNSIFHVS